MIKTWNQRCEEHPDHDGIVTEAMIRERMQEEIDELRAAIEQRQWQGLTVEEIWACNVAPAGHHVECHICVEHQNVLDFAEAIEAKLKEKNNA